jgi:hypothetical protein
MFGSLEYARAEDAQCHADGGKAVASLDELPAKVQDLLGRATTGIDGIADIGGKFNPSDAIIDNTVPMRRLVGGTTSHHCILLTIEYGGIGHHQKTLEFRLEETGWVLATDMRLKRAPAAPPAVGR